MDTPEFPQNPPIPQPGLAAQPDLAELREQFASLQHLIMSVLILMIVVSGTLCIFLLRQYKYTKTELDALVRGKAPEYIAQYQQTRGPQADMLIKKLAEFGKTNPDFQPILNKYGIKEVAATGVARTGTAPLAPTNSFKK